MKKHLMTLAFGVGTVLFGFVGLFKFMSGLEATIASFIRAFWGMATLIMIAGAIKREVFIATPTHFARCLGWGALMGLVVLLFFKTIDIANQSLAVILLFGGQGLWFPLYVYFFLPQESQKTRWSVYLATTVMTISGIICVLGSVANSSNINIFETAFYGLCCSFTAFIYFVAGRWLFFGDNKEERALLKRILPNQVIEHLTNDEQRSVQLLSPFWAAFQKTLFQIIGMCLVTAFLISDVNSVLIAFSTPTALIYGFLLGVICLAAAILLITWADIAVHTDSNGEVHRLPTKFKGISQQIELTIALIAGYIFLHDRLGSVGWVGVFILMSSYMIGIFWSERIVILTHTNPEAEE